MEVLTHLRGLIRGPPTKAATEEGGLWNYCIYKTKKQENTYNSIYRDSFTSYTTLCSSYDEKLNYIIFR